MPAGSDRPSPVFEGLGDLGVAPLALVPQGDSGVTTGAAVGLAQAGAGNQGQVAQAILLEVHGHNAWTEGKTNETEMSPWGITEAWPPPHVLVAFY